MPQNEKKSPNERNIYTDFVPTLSPASAYAIPMEKLHEDCAGQVGRFYIQQVILGLEVYPSHSHFPSTCMKQTTSPISSRAVEISAIPITHYGTLVHITTNGPICLTHCRYSQHYRKSPVRQMYHKPRTNSEIIT